MNENLPLYDDAGINLADPNDHSGRKTKYISLLQTMALRSILKKTSGVAVDVGCGYGRMSKALLSLGYDSVIGVDPSERVLRSASKLNPDIDFVTGSLPDLPFDSGAIDAIFLLNVLRALHLMGKLDIASGAAAPLKKGGQLVVLDNIRRGHDKYIEEEKIISMFEKNADLHLVSRTAIRGARWPWIYMIQFGLIPEKWYGQLAQWELDFMRNRKSAPVRQYYNVVWVFEKA